MTNQSDLDLIAQYVKRCRSHGMSFRRAGLLWMEKDGTVALEALARVRQPGFSWTPRSERSEPEIDLTEEP